MQKFFFNKKLVITLVALIVSFLLITFSIVVRNNRSTPTIIQQIGNEAFGLVDRLVSYPVAAVTSVGSNVSDLLNTYNENKKLKQQVDSLASQKVENQTLEKENKQLKQQLKLNKSLTNYTKITAYVLSRSPSTWENQIVISKGSLSGVTKNSAVVSNKGLVGRVVEVNKSNSKVELITTQNDSSDRFAVQLEVNGEVINGLITDYNSKKNLLVMGQITSKTKIKKNTKVITSGMGGNTPKGLLVGTVASTADDDDGLATKVYIKPAADLTDLSVVTVAKRTD
ncbi:rod shape-determining protein MreC [Ligilactobacillus apodemi DSM 16634 = JCM 16172]|uniref:Cell shape-determining protein MreC n=1 Tax=Ligilactobacillus apodemi DSM 16634 = JCM 16172 TaxID=1423724 RepID=A0A0R1TZ51_9LACO|nr:rod shape-determining protein MreC [Ligilactobacillus apodemi]KRL84163.1 rod shape-determining protein MreC [Ligilactobacillus apodemi DSM 16634 = JCM 16172]MBD5069389.1 rod shape-determining protein MreC [Lactobacillus sp.]